MTIAEVLGSADEYIAYCNLKNIKANPAIVKVLTSHGKNHISEDADQSCAEKFQEALSGLSDAKFAIVMDMIRFLDWKNRCGTNVAPG